MSVTGAPGTRERRTAHAPATCGAAIDVPLNDANPPPGTEDVMTSPGASSRRNSLAFEKSDTWSAWRPKLPSVVEPTLIADEMQAGSEIAFVAPSLPDDTTVAIPAARSWSMIAFRALSSQGAVNRPPPRLMLTAAMLKVARRS